MTDKGKKKDEKPPVEKEFRFAGGARPTRIYKRTTFECVKDGYGKKPAKIFGR